MILESHSSEFIQNLLIFKIFFTILQVERVRLRLKQETNLLSLENYVSGSEL